LQEFVGIFEEILKLVALRAECFRGQLCRYFDSSDRRVFRNVTNFVDLDAGFTSEGGLQLFGKRGRLSVATGKRAHETSKLGLRKSRRKVNAGDSGAHQHLRETFFASGCAERHAVEQDLISRSAKQEAAAGALIERTSEFLPRSFKLRRRPHMSKFVEACELQQDVQAADECPRAPTRFGAHSIRPRKPTLPMLPTTLVASPPSDKPHGIQCNLFNNRGLSRWARNRPVQPRRTVASYPSSGLPCVARQCGSLYNTLDLVLSFFRRRRFPRAGFPFGEK
jgi:hypothetical protein